MSDTAGQTHATEETFPAKASGVHDLGGKSGFGPVPADDNAIFHADWERRAFAVSQLAQIAAGFNTDAFRHGVEREDPDLYLQIPYFDKWIRNGERMLVEGGVLAADEVSARMNGTESTGEPVRTTDAIPHGERGVRRPTDQPAVYSAGARVRVRTDHAPTGHTRLPRYVRGHTGVVERVNESWIFPDTHAHGEGEDPTWVYAVRFDAADLWPDDHPTGPGHTVLVDLYEPYLETP